MKAILINLLFVPLLFIQVHHAQMPDSRGYLDIQSDPDISNGGLNLFDPALENPLYPLGPDSTPDSGSSEIPQVEFFCFYDRFPHFPGGDEARIAWLKSNLKYPKSSKDANVTGIVYCSFKVGIDGGISEVKIMRGLDTAINTEVIRVVSSMPRWEWDENDGKNYPLQFVMPINFVLDTDTDNKVVYVHKSDQYPAQEETLATSVADSTTPADPGVSALNYSREPADSLLKNQSDKTEISNHNMIDTNIKYHSIDMTESSYAFEGSSVKSALKLFPNPCDALLTVDLENSNQEKVLISITDLQGRVVFQDVMTIPARIDVSRFPSSVYVVKVSDEMSLKGSGCFVRP